jgi:hypothetical protein
VTGFTGTPDPLSIVTLLCAAIALVSLWRDRRHPITFTLVLLGSAALMVALLIPPSTPLCVVMVACVLARMIDVASVSDSLRLRRAALGSSLGLAALLLARVGADWSAEHDPAWREKRIAFVSGLRWMRTNTESGGAWNSPRSPSTWGVLSTVADGPLVQYHARRPAIVSPWGVLSGPRSIEQACKAWWEDWPRFERFLVGQRVRYVVVPGAWRWQLDLAPPFVAEPARRERLRLLNPLPAGTTHAATREGNLERVHARGLLVDLSGNPVQPVISIWRLDTAEVEQAQPQMRAR